MIRYNLRILFRNKVLWAWPAIFLILMLGIFTWGDISPEPNSYSFFIMVGDASIPVNLVINQIISLVLLIAIIGLPSHLSENIEPESASLLLSKSISRSDFFLADLGAVAIFTFAYTFISVLLLGIVVVFKGAIFPFQFFAGMFLFFPLLIMTYYVTAALILILTNSYLGAVFLGYVLTGFSSIFLNLKQVLQFFGIQSKLTRVAINLLSYLIPSAEGVQRIMSQIFNGGFAAIDGSLLIFVLISCLPLGLVSYFLFLKKEF